MKDSRTLGFLLKRVDCNDGVSSHCEILISGLKAAGWKVILITGAVSYDAASIRRLEAFKNMVEDWIILEQFNPLRPNLKQINLIREVTKKYGIALFHVHGYSMLMLTYLIKIFTGINCVATFHPSVHSDNPHQIKAKLNFKQRLEYRTYLNLFTPQAFIAISSDIEKFLVEELNFSKIRVFKILNGVDTEYFRAPTAEEHQNSRKKLALQDEEFVCALVGRLSWNKGHDVLISAVRRIKSLSPESSVKCLFIGSGDQENDIKKYALGDEVDRDCFMFLGFVDQLREIYWASDVFVLPSRLEGFALVIAEAMSCGTVPIRTPSGGAIDQIEDGNNGFIIPFDDAETLALRLQQLLENKELRRQMSEAALDLAQKKFTVEQMTKKTIAVYEKVIKERNLSKHSKKMS